MGIYSIKPAFQNRLGGLRDIAIRMGISADALTISAVVLSIAGALAIWLSQRDPLVLLLVPLFSLGRITLNALDGMVAVQTGNARPFGMVLNEFADRLSDIAWFMGIASVIGGSVAFFALIAVLLGSYVGTVAKAAGAERIYKGVMGKADRMILLSATSLVAFWMGSSVFVYFCWLVMALCIITVIQRLVIAHRTLGEIDRAP